MNNSSKIIYVALICLIFLSGLHGQAAQHSKSMHGMFAHIPGLKVVLPTSPQDAYSLLRSSIRDDADCIAQPALHSPRGDTQT